jgi:hypothetical protein
MQKMRTHSDDIRGIHVMPKPGYPMPVEHAAYFLSRQTESYQTRCLNYWLSRGYPESFNNAVKKEMARKHG